MKSVNCNKLAINGGAKSIVVSQPHEVWPPQASQAELNEIIDQRKFDISIKGKTGIISDLENIFLDFLENKVKYAITFNSGTSGLLAAYYAIGIDEDDEVIGPALTYHAALSPAYMLKANIKLVDIDIENRCIDPYKIERVITDKTKAITVVHQWGHPADMDKIIQIADKYNLKIIEDCSHAHGSKYKGKPCGTFGDVAVFSFQAAKMIYAGEGGILVTNSKSIYERATLLGHYRDRSRDEVEDPMLQRYWVTGFGLKLRMSPLNAVVAKHAILEFPDRKKQRHQCLSYFNKRLAEINYIKPHFVGKDIDMGAWYGFKPLYKKEFLNNIPIQNVVAALQAEGMEVTCASAPALSNTPLFSDTKMIMFKNRKGFVPNSPSATPVALQVENEALSLPTFYNWNKDKEIIDQYICAFKKLQENSHEIF